MNIKVKKFGQFTLLKQIARGGMAEIFLGCSGKFESAYKFVVIKRILLAHSHNKEFNKMFQNEGKIAVNLSHSNVGSIHEFGIENDQYFICMEYISGRNLRQLAKKLKSQKRNLDVAMCVYLIKGVCSGLDYAHNCTDSITGQPLNIIHRDISPQNIMISFDGDVKVIDFGIAKIDDSEATRVGVLKGKFEYMSPEQVGGKNLDRQTDIFSLGNVLWELLACKKLFTGSNEIQLLKKIKDCRIPDLRKINPKVPDKLVTIVNKALSANKNLRYKTAAEMGNDLSIFLNKSYPEFIQTHFSSFIKEVYVEEILEERQNLKMYLQALVSKKSNKKGKSLSVMPLNEGDTVTRKSTFIGYEGNLSGSGVVDEEDTGVEEKSSEQYTVTQTESEAQTTPSQEITKTEFDDDALDGNVYTKPRIVESEGYRNIITNTKTKTGDVTHSSQKYNPWQKTMAGKSYSTSVRVRHRSSPRKPPIFKKALVSLCVLSVAGFAYFFMPDNVMLFVQKNVSALFKNHKSDSPGETPSVKTPSPETPVRKPTAKETVDADPEVKPRRKASIETPVFGKNILITTQPSGAQIYINNEKMDRRTPISVTVPYNKKFKLTLKREGYFDKKVTLSPQSLKHIINFPLEKRKKGKRNHAPIVIR